MDNNAISFSISDERREFLAEEMASGNYADESDIVDPALGLLETRKKIGVLRALIAEGDADIAAGRIYEYETTEDFLKDIMSEDGKN